MDTVERRRSSGQASRESGKPRAHAPLRYQSGFASEFATEALPGALP